MNKINSNTIDETYSSDVSENSGTIPLDVLEEISALINRAIVLMMEYTHDPALTGASRKRLRGIGVRRNGFVKTVLSFAELRPELVPQYINTANFKEMLHQVDMLQNITSLLKQLERINGNNLLVCADEAYRNSLVFYNSVKEASRTRVTGAEAVEDMLKPFFANMRPTQKKPTEKEILRDVHGLLHGTKEGRVVVANENPRVVHGERFVAVNVED